MIINKIIRNTDFFFVRLIIHFEFWLLFVYAFRLLLSTLAIFNYFVGGMLEIGSVGGGKKISMDPLTGEVWSQWICLFFSIIIIINYKSLYWLRNMYYGQIPLYSVLILGFDAGNPWQLRSKINSGEKYSRQ